jgi:hypothetical protein
MGRWGHIDRSSGACPRALLAACLAAALALVALPTGAAADSRVPPSSCPPENTFAGLERAPGGVVFTGTVTTVTPEVGMVRLEVIDWYHRGRVAGLQQGVHPATVDVLLGNRLALAGEMVPPRMPAVGSRFLVAGTWLHAERPVIARCGVVANLNYEAGAARLAEAQARYAAVPPTATGSALPFLPSVPLEAPLLLLGLAVAGLLLAAAVLEAIADSRDPLPAV